MSELKEEVKQEGDFKIKSKSKLKKFSNKTEEPVEESSSIIEEIQEGGEKPLPKQEQIVQPKIELPDNVEKLIAFMKETGGTIEDYTRLNADYSDVDEDTLLREYYKKRRNCKS